MLLCTNEYVEKPMAGSADWKGMSPTPASTFVSALRADKRMRESIFGAPERSVGPYLANDACKDFMSTGLHGGEMSQTPSS